MAKPSVLFTLALAVKTGKSKLADVPRGLKGHVTRLVQMPQEELERFTASPAAAARTAPARTGVPIRRAHTT